MVYDVGSLDHTFFAFAILFFPGRFGLSAGLVGLRGGGGGGTRLTVRSTLVGKVREATVRLQ